MNDLTYTFADMPYRTYQYSLGNNNYIRVRVVHIPVSVTSRRTLTCGCRIASCVHDAPLPINWH